jgi:hypothetical protein
LVGTLKLTIFLLVACWLVAVVATPIKQGSSTINAWLWRHAELNVPKREEHKMLGTFSPATVIRKNLYRRHVKQRQQQRRNNSSNTTTIAADDDDDAAPPYMHFGYKCPTEILSVKAIHALQTYWPETKLIVGIRHPILWFQSFYNFRIQDHTPPLPSNTSLLIGPCILDEHVCTDHARFHLHLSRLVDTTTTTATTMAAPTTPTTARGEPRQSPTNPQPRHWNPLFLFEMTQFLFNESSASSSSTSSISSSSSLSQFRTTFSNFLDLQTPLPEIPHIRPNHAQEGGHRQRLYAGRLKRHGIDICDAQHEPVRAVLLQHAQATHDFITTHVLSSPHVVVSSPSFFRQVLESYRTDPCIRQGV